MDQDQPPKIILSYLKKRFTVFKILKRLSYFAQTYLIVGDREEYVIKLIEYRNIVSIIRHNKRHVDNIVSMSFKVNSLKNIKTISVVDSVSGMQCSILLIKKEKLSDIKIENPIDFKRIGKAIYSFHKACNPVAFQDLPWNNFPKHFVDALRKNNRWKIVKKFIDKNRSNIDKSHIITCHNDIHDKNIFLSGRKVIFLDVDDMCRASYFSDLGMVIANFTNSKYSEKKLQQTIKWLLKGYKKDYTIVRAKNIILYALRKLYFTEAYFLYIQKSSHGSEVFIKELRKRQDLLSSFVDDYL